MSKMNIELWRYILRLQTSDKLTASEAKHLDFWQKQLGI